MKIDYLQALKRIPEARGAWILHGQEPLLEQNLLDTFRKSWQQQEVERQRYDISSVSDWKNVFNALNSLSLFSQQLAIEVHGNIKPDANGLKQLKSYIQHNETNLLLIVLPKQDSSSLKSAFSKLWKQMVLLLPLRQTIRKTAKEFYLPKQRNSKFNSIMTHGSGSCSIMSIICSQLRIV